MFIDIFGTDASTSTEHGGIVYQQVAIKSCFGGSITDGMLHDIDALIRRVPPGNTAYLRYRQSGATNILGVRKLNKIREIQNYILIELEKE
jgi:hypothetical protein